MSTANLMDGLVALNKDGKMVSIRVPYPLGFYAKGFDGRIDDPNAGWKGRGLVGCKRRSHAMADRSRKGTKPLAAHFQLRPDPWRTEIPAARVTQSRPVPVRGSLMISCSTTFRQHVLDHPGPRHSCVAAVALARALTHQAAAVLAPPRAGAAGGFVTHFRSVSVQDMPPLVACCGSSFSSFGAWIYAGPSPRAHPDSSRNSCGKTLGVFEMKEHTPDRPRAAAGLLASLEERAQRGV